MAQRRSISHTAPMPPRHGATTRHPRRLPGLLVAPALLGLIVAVSPASDTTAQPGPTGDEALTHVFEDRVDLHSDAMTVGVSPATGRIVSFRGGDGVERLWVGDAAGARMAQAAGGWVNYGGDKLWVSLQATWKISQDQNGDWPPDPTIDGKPWALLDHHATSDTASHGKPTLSIRGGPVGSVGVIAQRDITIDGDALVIDNRIRRVARSPHAVHAWSVTQARLPRYVLVGLSPLRPIEATHVWVMRPGAEQSPKIDPLLGGRVLILDPATFRGAKPGVFGDWVAAVYDDAVFVQRQPLDPDGYYPEAASITVYSADQYIELETLSPARHLKLGETLEHAVRWQLLTWPGEGVGDTAVTPDRPEAVARWLLDQ